MKVLDATFTEAEAIMLREALTEYAFFLRAGTRKGQESTLPEARQRNIRQAEALKETFAGWLERGGRRAI